MWEVLIMSTRFCFTYQTAALLPILGAVLSLLILFPVAVAARQGELPISWSWTAATLAEVEVHQLPSIETTSLLVEFAPHPGEPIQFAVPNTVSITPYNAGQWTTQADGSQIWRLRFHAPGATDLNVGFTDYALPPNAELYIYSEDKSYYEGPYTSLDNKPHRQLWTPVVPTSRAVIELHLPAGFSDRVVLRIGQVGAGFRDLFGRASGRGFSLKQGSCNNDVICPVGDPWRNEIRSVARILIDGVFLCTGSLIMDVLGSFKPFFLTAYHCDVTANNAATVVAYWNFQSPVCGDLSGGSLGQNQTGAIFRAGRQDVDVTLLELDTKPDPAFNVYYSGWDATGVTPQSSVGIHHPSGDEKAISFNSNPLVTGASCSVLGNNTHWQVDNWEDGTTEPGSSGSGLWDPATHKLVGFLTAGTASCDNTAGFDCYGKFSVAWDGALAAERLRDWLDPFNTGILMVDGDEESFDVPGASEPQNIPLLNAWGLGGLISLFGLALLRLRRQR